MKKLFIFGTGPIAEVAFHHFKEEKKYEIVAFVEFKKFIKKKKIFNINIVEYEKIEKTLPKQNHYAFVALGYKELNKFRTKIYKDLKKKNISLRHIFHQTLLLLKMYQLVKIAYYWMGK